MKHRVPVASAMLALSLSAGACEYPPYLPRVLADLYPAAHPADDYTLTTDADGRYCIDHWGLPGVAPTPAEIIAAAPPILLDACEARLRAAADAAIEARGQLTWSGASEARIARLIALQKPNPAVVAAYTADTDAMDVALTAALADAATRSVDDRWTCAQTGALPAGGE